MTDQGAAFALILMDALAHRRDCLRAEPGELLERLLVVCFWESEAEGRDMSEWHEWLASKGVEVRLRAHPPYDRFEFGRHLVIGATHASATCWRATGQRLPSLVHFG
jgi:hypothetical protein